MKFAGVDLMPGIKWFGISLALHAAVVGTIAVLMMRW
jgi:hypothetical protein